MFKTAVLIKSSEFTDITEFHFIFHLGYLQQENLTSTCQAFILESSDLKEYAEHCTDEGFIPACLLVSDLFLKEVFHH